MPANLLLLAVRIRSRTVVTKIYRYECVSLSEAEWAFIETKSSRSELLFGLHVFN